jgi:ketosteroid isomerase-like protein
MRVTWTHRGKRDPHAATADDGSFDTGELNVGESRTKTFSTAGRFPYHCTVHVVSMSGVVIVAPVGGGKAAALAPLERAWAKAVESNEANRIAKFFTDDFLFVGAGGVLQNRAQHLADFSSGWLHVDSVSIESMTERIHGDFAVVSLTVAVKGKFGDRDITGGYQFTDSWVRGEDGNWRALARQQTRIIQTGANGPTKNIP